MRPQSICICEDCYDAPMAMKQVKSFMESNLEPGSDLQLWPASTVAFQHLLVAHFLMRFLSQSLTFS